MKRRPDWWDAQRRHLASTPPPAGLRALANDVSRGSKPVRTRRLRGGMGTSTHVVDLQTRSGAIRQVVLKRFREDDGAAKEEWERTVFAQRLPVPSPEPIAFDGAGEWFGAPSIVISRLEGRPLLRPRDHDRWYAEIAQSMLAISSVSTNRLPAIVRGPQPGEGWKPHDDMRRTPMVERAIDAVQRLLPKSLGEKPVVGHCDMHPGNMLWTNQRMTGLVDWRSTNLAQRTREVVYCRIEMAVLFGLREADRFLSAYEREAGEQLDHVPAWDLVQGLTAMRWCWGWAYAYREQGRTDLTDEIAQRRARAFVRRALDDLGER